MKNVTIAYKNVLKTIKGLESNRLIEKVKGKFPRRAKKYQLATQGTYRLLSTGPILPFQMKYLKENEIIKAVVYQFIEEQTLIF